MTFYVNAWLNRPEPFVSLHNKLTGEVVAYFDKTSLQVCLEQGDFCIQDLCSAKPQAQQELVKCLLLKHCSKQLYTQLNSLIPFQSVSSVSTKAQVLAFRRI